MIDYEYSELFLESSITKEFYIRYDESGEITNSDLYSESFMLTESLCSDRQLKFGACEVSSVKFKILNSGISLKNKVIDVSLVIGGHSELPFNIGTYTIVSDKPTADRFGRDITAYDAMYDILNADMLAWWNELPNTFTVKILRDAFFNYFNIQQETIALDNDSLIITKTAPKSLSGKQIITAICEINGCFGHIGRDNKMHYLFLREVIEGLYPSVDLFPQEDLYPRVERVGSILEKQHYIHAEYEDYMIQHINKVNVYNRQNNVIASHGTGTNIYNITDNILVDGMTNAVAQNMVDTIYSTMAGVWYMPCKVECVGTPCIEVGDSVRLNTTDKVIYMYVMERTLKGIQALIDTLESHGDEYRTDDMNSLSRQVSAVTAQAEETANNLAITNDNVYAVGIVANGANNLAGTANTAARNAQDTADDAVTRVGRIEANYVRTNDLEAINANIQSLSTTVANINRAYITEAECKRIAANSVDSYFAHLSSLVVSGNITCKQVTIGSLSYTGKSATVRLANGNTRTIYYLGWG